MRIITAQSENPDTGAACAEIVEQIRAAGDAPDFLAVHMDACHGTDVLRHALTDAFAGAFHGASSCRGIMTGAGHQTDTEGGIGAFCIHDPEGDYGTAAAPLGEDARAAARDATERALEAADRDGEAPALIWLSVTPGQEERVIAGIEDVVGRSVPIVGGSAADNDISGNWVVMDAQTVIGDGVVVSVLFPSARITFAYHSGYTPNGHSGIATKVAGRQVLEIDGRPAVEVYSEWSRGEVVAPTVDTAQNILSSSTFWPLGREVAQVMGVPYHLLAHPSGANPDGSLSLFADIGEGERLTQMMGDAGVLAARAGRVASQAVAALDPDADDVLGALMVYCGGCMLGVQDRMGDVVQGVRDTLGDAPFLGVFTFGEQGPVLDTGNRHGNLMISAVVFSKRK